MARFTAAAWPAITTWSGEFRLAALTISPCAACSQNALQLSLGQLEERGHGSDSRRHGLLHVAAAPADQAHGIGERQAAGGDQGRILAQTVPRDEVGRGADLPEDGERGGRDREQRGLRVFRELESVLRAFETQAGDRESESIVGLFEHAARGGVRIGESFAHARGLRALAGEEKCGGRCQRRL